MRIGLEGGTVAHLIKYFSWKCKVLGLILRIHVKKLSIAAHSCDAYTHSCDVHTHSYDVHTHTPVLHTHTPVMVWRRHLKQFWAFEPLLATWWHCLGKLRGHGLVRRVSSLQVAFEDSKLHASVLSLFCVSCWQLRMWTTPLCYHTSLPWWWLSLLPLEP